MLIVSYGIVNEKKVGGHWIKQEEVRLKKKKKGIVEMNFA